MWVPDKFVEMPIEIARIKCPYEQRPKFILTNLGLDVNVSINLFEQSITEEEIPQAINGYKMLLRQSQPLILFIQEAVEDLDGKKLGWFDYIRIRSTIKSITLCF